MLTNKKGSISYLAFQLVIIDRLCHFQTSWWGHLLYSLKNIGNSFETYSVAGKELNSTFLYNITFEQQLDKTKTINRL